MADFHKWIPVLALLALLAGTASAQVGPALTCTSNAGVPPIVRAEGLTELVGDVVLNCTGGTAGQSFLVNWQIFLNTNMTSRLIQGSSSRTEALLMIDELQATGGVPCLAADSAAPCAGSATANTFRGSKGAGDNTLVWLGVPFVAPGSGTRVIRITNVRANANQIGASSTLVPSQIVMYISANASQSVPINNPQQTVAFIQQGLLFDVRNCKNDDSVGDNNKFNQCSSINSTQFGTSSETADLSSSGRRPGSEMTLRFRENFATAFKPQIYTAQLTSGPGAVYNSESGFVHPRLAEGGAQETGLATSGTRLIARFSNIPAGVKIEVGTDNTWGSSTLPIALISADVNGLSGITPILGLPAILQASSTGNKCSLDTSKTFSAAEIPISATGTATAVWEVLNANANGSENAAIPVIVSFKADTANSLPGVGTATVVGGFAPVVTGSDAGKAQSGPVPRFADASISRTLFTINTCATNLLFPFITNAAPFDTGIAIANTSADPFGTANQTGTCKLNFYGSTSGGGAAPAAITTQAVAAGGTLLFSLSSGGTHGVGTQAAGFTGYMIAQCSFQYAHGFAFISDLGATKLAQGYLALVMDTPLAARDKTATSESLKVGS